MFIEAKDDGSGGDNWSYKSCKAPVKSSPPTNHTQFFYRPDALPVDQPTVSKHWREKYHIPWTYLCQAHLGSSNFVFVFVFPTLVTLGEVCHASHQPSDASTVSLCTVQRQYILHRSLLVAPWGVLPSLPSALWLLMVMSVTCLVLWYISYTDLFLYVYWI